MRKKSYLSLLPALLTAVLPKCPACLAFYASTLGLVGVGSFHPGQWLLPLTVLCMLGALTPFLLRARRGHYGPMLLALAACGLFLAGKWVLDLPLLAASAH